MKFSEKAGLTTAEGVKLSGAFYSAGTENGCDSGEGRALSRLPKVQNTDNLYLCESLRQKDRILKALAALR